MVFSSVAFLYFFLPVFLLLYWVLPLRNVVLLTASLFFYAWGEFEYVLLLVGSIALNYSFGIAIAKASPPASRWLLGLGISSNVLLLGAFKYANFIVDSVAPWLGSDIRVEAIHLPIGISFYTFQAMSYLIDVYRKDAQAERDPIVLATYISMFPQLIAGPIVRFASIQHELHRREVDAKKVEHGIRVFVLGLSQKVLIANTLAVPVDAIFAIPPGQLTAPVAWLGMVTFPLQIYFDFAGYSNMAIGLGLMLGFHLPKNFDYPYISQSIREMWRRWHISLSSWFRDYLYFPLGGNRKGALRTYLNLVTIFFICGLWHGAAWTFVVWGLWNGLFLVVERAGLGAVLDRAWRPLRHTYTMLVWSAGMVIFRSDSLSYAFDYLLAIVGLGAGDGLSHHVGLYLRANVVLVLAIAVLGSTPLFAAVGRWSAERARSGASVALIRGSVVVGIGAMLLFVGMSLAAGTHNPFIYFRF
ncbi:MAG: MBOAT family O-acyltransferase [Myxococcota bacterium]